MGGEGGACLFGRVHHPQCRSRCRVESLADHLAMAFDEQQAEANEKAGDGGPSAGHPASGANSSHNRQPGRGSLLSLILPVSSAVSPDPELLFSHGANASKMRARPAEVPFIDPHLSNTTLKTPGRTSSSVVLTLRADRVPRSLACRAQSMCPFARHRAVAGAENRVFGLLTWHHRGQPKPNRTFAFTLTLTFTDLVGKKQRTGNQDPGSDYSIRGCSFHLNGQ